MSGNRACRCRWASAWVAALVCLAPAPPAAAEDASARVEILVRDAERLYHEGRHTQAVAKYDQASALAFREGASGRAFELSRTAAAILQRQGDAAVGPRLRRLALGAANHPDAISTHWLACVSSRAAPQAESGAGGYSELLREHIEQWPESQHAGDAKRLLVSAYAQQGDWRQSADAFEAYAPGERKVVAAVGAYALAVVKLRGSDDAERLRRATDLLQPLITGRENRWPDLWTDQQRDAALALAQIHLAYKIAGPEYPFRMVIAASTGEPRPDPAWDARAADAVITAAAATGDWEPVAPLAGRWGGQPLAVARSAAERLAALLGQAKDPAPIARVLSALTRDHATDAATDAELRRANLVARAALNDPVAAEELLKRVDESADPDVGELRVLAIAASGRRDEESLDRAVRLWARLERQAAKGGALFGEARLARIESLLQLGRREEAAKLCRLTLLLGSLQADAAQLERLRLLARRLGADDGRSARP